MGSCFDSVKLATGNAIILSAGRMVSKNKWNLGQDLFGSMSIPTMKTILTTMQSQIRFYRGLRCLPAMRPRICILKSLLPPAPVHPGQSSPLSWRSAQAFAFMAATPGAHTTVLQFPPAEAHPRVSLCLALSIGTQCLPYSFLLVTYFSLHIQCPFPYVTLQVLCSHLCLLLKQQPRQTEKGALVPVWKHFVLLLVQKVQTIKQEVP